MPPYLILLLSLASYASASCGSSPPSGGDYAILAVGSDRGLTTSLNDTKGAVGLAMNSPKTDCDASCLYTLEYYSAPHGQSTLIVRKELTELIPVGYTRVTNRPTVYCARSNGQCGAALPIWRHYFVNATGIYHSYALNDSSVDGFTKESSPLCFAWPIQTNGIFTSTVKPVTSSTVSSTTRTSSTPSTTQTTRTSTVSSTITPFTTRSSTVSSTSTTQTTRTSTVSSTSSSTPTTRTSTRKSTLTPSALNQIFVRMVETVLGNDPNWRDNVKKGLREISDIL